MFISDVLPLVDALSWSCIAASFRLEDGNSGIYFEAADGKLIAATPSVGISNTFMADEVSQWTAMEFMGEKSDDEIGLAWEEAKRDYAQLIISSARESGLGSAVGIAHQPLTVRVYCYDEVLIEQCV